MPYGITQCYLPPDKGVNPPLPAAEAGVSSLPIEGGASAKENCRQFQRLTKRRHFGINAGKCQALYLIDQTPLLRYNLRICINLRQKQDTHVQHSPPGGKATAFSWRKKLKINPMVVLHHTYLVNQF